MDGKGEREREREREKRRKKNISDAIAISYIQERSYSPAHRRVCLLVFGERPRKGERRSPSGLEDERPYLTWRRYLANTRHISAFHSLAFLFLLLLLLLSRSHRHVRSKLASFLFAVVSFNADAYYRCLRSFEDETFDHCFLFRSSIFRFPEDR